MASLHRDPRGKSPYWYAAYRTAAGTRKFVSTKHVSHRAALEIALNLERAELEGARAQLTETRVRELLSDTLERINGRTVERVTVRSWLTRWASRNFVRSCVTQERASSEEVDLPLAGSYLALHAKHKLTEYPTVLHRPPRWCW